MVGRSGRAEDVGVDDVVEASVGRRHGPGRIGAHPHGPGLVVGRAQTVAVAGDDVARRRPDDDGAEVVGHGVHGVPRGPVVGGLDGLAGSRRVTGIAEADERATDAELVGVAGERHAVGRVARLELADAAQRDDDVVVVGAARASRCATRRRRSRPQPAHPAAVTCTWKWLTVPSVA